VVSFPVVLVKKAGSSWHGPGGSQLGLGYEVNKSRREIYHLQVQVRVRQMIDERRRVEALTEMQTRKHPRKVCTGCTTENVLSGHRGPREPPDGGVDGRHVACTLPEREPNCGCRALRASVDGHSLGGVPPDLPTLISILG
jgi:hypothetical protein